MCIANHPQRGGIDEVNVAAHQFSKRRFGPLAGVILQELLVGKTVHSEDTTRRGLNRTARMGRVQAAETAQQGH